MKSNHPLDLEQSFDQLYRENLHPSFNTYIIPSANIHLAEDHAPKLLSARLNRSTVSNRLIKFKPWLFTIRP